MSHLAVDLLLIAGVAAVWVGVLGVLAMPDFYARLHYMGVAATLGVIGIAVAVLVREGLHASGIKVILIAVILFVMNPVLTHATARAARNRQYGDWRLQPGDRGGPG